MQNQDMILVVDDEQPVRQVIGTLLETEGFGVMGGLGCDRVACA